VPGNNELRLTKQEKRAGTFANSIAKFHHVLRMCEQLDVCTQVGSPQSSL
jgi:hypothetical protein